MKKIILITVIAGSLMAAGFSGCSSQPKNPAPLKVSESPPISQPVPETQSSGKAWLNSKAEELAQKLPGVLAEFAKRGVEFGEGQLTEVQGKHNTMIDATIGKGEGFVSDPDVSAGIDRLGDIENLKGFVFKGAGSRESALNLFQGAMESAG